jgi:hypothetical protein
MGDGGPSDRLSSSNAIFTPSPARASPHAATLGAVVFRGAVGSRSGAARSRRSRSGGGGARFCRIKRGSIRARCQVNTVFSSGHEASVLFCGSAGKLPALPVALLLALWCGILSHTIRRSALDRARASYRLAHASRTTSTTMATRDTPRDGDTAQLAVRLGPCPVRHHTQRKCSQQGRCQGGPGASVLPPLTSSWRGQSHARPCICPLGSEGSDEGTVPQLTQSAAPRQASVNAAARHCWQAARAGALSLSPCQL